MHLTKRRLGLLLFLVIIGGWLRVWKIGSQSLWFDEVFSRNVAVQSDIPSILRDGVAGDVHPPLYFVLLNAWAHLTGDSETALRMLSALIMLLVLPAFYHLGRLMFNERTGLAALALGALSPFQIYYAQEARQYALSILFAAWAGVGLVALLRGKRYGWPLYVIAAAGGMYTHYFIGILLAAIHIWLVLYAPARKQWRRWLTADLAIALLFVPQLLIFAHQTQAVLGDFWIQRRNIGALLTTPTFLLFSTTLPDFVLAVTEVVVTLVLVIGALDVLRRAPRPARAYWLMCMAAIFLTLIVTFAYSVIRSPIYLDRSFGLLSPFLLVAIAAGYTLARRPSPAPLLFGALILIMISGSVYHALAANPDKPPFRQVAADLQAQPDALSVPILHVHDASYLPMHYYAPLLDQRLGDLQARSWLFPKTWQIFGVERLSPDQLTQWLSSYHGKLRVIMPSSVEAPGLALVTQLRKAACSEQVIVYPGSAAPPSIFVYELTLGPCLTLNLPHVP